LIAPKTVLFEKCIWISSLTLLAAVTYTKTFLQLDYITIAAIASFKRKIRTFSRKFNRKEKGPPSESGKDYRNEKKNRLKIGF